MPRCLHCFYILILLERRRKYKCAKCSRLWSQKLIENREFRKWNKCQREEERKSLFPARNKKARGIPLAERRALMAFRLLFNERRKVLTPEERREKKQAYRIASRQQYYAWRAQYRNVNREQVRLLTRIGFWRQRQKELALEMLENTAYWL